MLRYVIVAGLLANMPLVVVDAQAQSTVECLSTHYQYDECFAGPLQKPQLIHQISSSPCILNRTWGYNPRSKYVWVSEGCSGVFADVGGYHHGRGDGFDAGARMYDNQGHDVGEVIGGAVLGAIIAGAAGNDHRNHSHTTTNYTYNNNYSGCHGIGCKVDKPDDEVDNTPQFDKEGEPNFDEHGNYQGCHGLGCLTDDPGDDDSSE